jgi:serine/threonine protein kinase
MSENTKEKKQRIWRLSSDVVIRPVTEMPPEVIEQVTGSGKNPATYFGIERQRSRALAKIVNQDVIEVLKAFGDEGATYEDVLNHFLETRQLKREELHPELAKMVNTFIGSNFLVEGRKTDGDASEAIEPTLEEGAAFLCYRILKNVNVIIDTEIYQVEHVPTGVLRALKVSRPSFPRESMKRKIFERLQSEFSIIQSMRHPGIVRVWEHGTHDGRMYGILDWIDGRSVYTYAHESGSTPTDSFLVALSIECLEALDAVHRAGYLHGDVHTRNFLAKQGHACLIDFGLARPIDLKEEDAERYPEGGVIRFMPPEYMRYRLEDRQGLWGSVPGEVYSCAVIIFSLLTKAYPYKWSLYRTDFMKNILEDAVPSFRDCERDPWPELEGLLQKALAKDPKDRFGSAGEFAQALRDLPVGHAAGQA